MGVNIEHQENVVALKLLTWDQVYFKDGKERENPVKSMTLRIEAGETAVLTIERDTMNGLFNAVSDNYKDGSKPLTYKTHYAVGEFSADIKVRALN